jgi:hypothetical protein
MSRIRCCITTCEASVKLKNVNFSSLRLTRSLLSLTRMVPALDPSTQRLIDAARRPLLRMIRLLKARLSPSEIAGVLAEFSAPERLLPGWQTALLSAQLPLPQCSAHGPHAQARDNCSAPASCRGAECGCSRKPTARAARRAR